MPSFSLAALTVLELAPPALIDVAAACGYHQVGLRLLPAMPGGVAYPLMEDKAGLKETLARLDAKARAQRALIAARNVIAGSFDGA